MCTQTHRQAGRQTAGCRDAPALMWLLGGGGEPGELAVSQQLKPAHLPPLHHAAGLPPVLQPPLSQDGHKLTLHLHAHTQAAC